jgi:hypothetical protein
MNTFLTEPGHTIYFRDPVHFSKPHSADALSNTWTKLEWVLESMHGPHADLIVKRPARRLGCSCTASGEVRKLQATLCPSTCCTAGNHAEQGTTTTAMAVGRGIQRRAAR